MKGDRKALPVTPQSEEKMEMGRGLQPRLNCSENHNKRNKKEHDKKQVLKRRLADKQLNRNILRQRNREPQLFKRFDISLLNFIGIDCIEIL